MLWPSALADAILKLLSLRSPIYTETSASQRETSLNGPITAYIHHGRNMCQNKDMCRSHYWGCDSTNRIEAVHIKMSTKCIRKSNIGYDFICFSDQLNRGFLNFELQVVSCELPVSRCELVKFKGTWLTTFGNHLYDALRLLCYMCACDQFNHDCSLSVVHKRKIR